MEEIQEELDSLRFDKCTRCYWYDNCPLNRYNEEDILEATTYTGSITPERYANYDNCKDYFEEYCSEFTPLDDFDIRIIEYEKSMKERYDDYVDLIEELN